MTKSKAKAKRKGPSLYNQNQWYPQALGQMKNFGNLQAVKSRSVQRKALIQFNVIT